ncbi:uncharacterized protein V1518DRAFT_413206 [Limtongia smithiae]|uniref:uncharacterized protein n=1 Tax=Limtongia smithiae TaxID=1125753 RepID=UPI0034CDF145
MAAASHEGLLNVGEHCSLSSCHRLDFLPFTCPECKSKYCSDHRHADSHQCPALSKRTEVRRSPSPRRSSPIAAAGGQRLGGSGSEKRMSCYAPDCNTVINTTLSPATICPTCRNMTCLKHRLTHKCPGTPIVKQSKEISAAKAALAKFAEWKNKQGAPPVATTSAKTATTAGTTATGISAYLKAKTGSSSGSSGSSVVARAKAVAALKAVAKGDTAVAPASRIYVYVETTVSGSTSKKVEMFFGKDYAVGKVLDKTAQRLQVTNHNSSKADDKDRLRLYHVEGGRVLEFSEKIGSARVRDGDTIALIKGLVLPSLLH